MLLAHVGGHDSTGSVRSRILRFVVGFLLVIVALTIVALIGEALGLDDGDGTGGVVWDFISTATTGLTIFLLAPLLFRRLHLASPIADDESPSPEPATPRSGSS